MGHEFDKPSELEKFLAARMREEIGKGAMRIAPNTKEDPLMKYIITRETEKIVDEVPDTTTEEFFNFIHQAALKAGLIDQE